MEKRIRRICGYVCNPSTEDPSAGIGPETAFESLPEGWVCPKCGRREGRVQVPRMAERAPRAAPRLGSRKEAA
jgi:rubredoxin